jgi:diacylglycerol kinase (ATP)
MPFSFGKRFSSFRHAFRGISIVIRSQHNAWIHLVATVLVVALGAFLSLSRFEWVAVVLAIGTVWSAEALNTAIEFLADEVSNEQRELIGKAKDVAAAGVLFAAFSAFVVGILVFVPHLAKFLRP